MVWGVDVCQGHPEEPNKMWELGALGFIVHMSLACCATPVQGFTWMSTCRGIYRLAPSRVPEDIAAFLKGKN